MILDSEKQRQALLSMINSSGFPGTEAEFVVSLKRAITVATVQGEVPPAVLARREGGGGRDGRRHMPRPVDRAGMPPAVARPPEAPEDHPGVIGRQPRVDTDAPLPPARPRGKKAPAS